MQLKGSIQEYNFILKWICMKYSIHQSKKQFINLVHILNIGINMNSYIFNSQYLK